MRILTFTTDCIKEDSQKGAVCSFSKKTKHIYGMICPNH